MSAVDDDLLRVYLAQLKPARPADGIERRFDAAAGDPGILVAQ